MTINDIKQTLLNVIDPDDPLLKQFEEDPRSGVQKLIVQTKKRIERNIQQQKDFQNRFMLEQKYWHQGQYLVAGIDEVGRGCLAGPVVAAAVILNSNFNLIQVNDSKQLSDKIRKQLYPQIIDQAISVGIGSVSNQVIDQIGILNATKQAMNMAIKNLDFIPGQLLVDAVEIPTTIKKEVMFKGDAKSNSIAAASIVAKVYRDQLMQDYDQIFPDYGFAKNVGYGTKEHLDGIRKFGITSIHRRTFEPVAKL